MIKKIEYNQGITEIEKDKILPMIKRELVAKMVTETDAESFCCDFVVNPYTDEEAWNYVWNHGSDNGTYFNYGKQYEPQELFDLVKKTCFTVKLYFKYEVEE